MREHLLHNTIDEYAPTSKLKTDAVARPVLPCSICWHAPQQRPEDKAAFSRHRTRHKRHTCTQGKIENEHGREPVQSSARPVEQKRTNRSSSYRLPLYAGLC